MKLAELSEGELRELLDSNELELAVFPRGVDAGHEAALALLESIQRENDVIRAALAERTQGQAETKAACEGTNNNATKE